MPLSAFTNTFAGNPLDRASYRRTDEIWLAEQLAAPDSLAIAIWNGKPLVETAKDGGTQIAYLAATMARELSGGPERLLFMGLWKETAVFAVDLEGGADPADGPLEGLGRFEDLRAIALTLPPATRPSWPPPSRCSNGAASTGTAPPAARSARSPTAAGSGSARPAAPSTSRAPIRW